MLIFTIIVTILLVLALLFIGWIFLDGYLNPSMAFSKTLADYTPKDMYIVKISAEEIGNKILRLETEVDYEYEDEDGGSRFITVYNHINYLCWFLPHKSEFWEDKLNKHYNNKIDKLKSKAEQRVDQFKEQP